MKAAWAICRRDLTQHFTSPLAWLVLFSWTLITNGIFYAEISIAHAYSTSPSPLFERSLTWGSWLLIMLAPAITMNNFAAERMQGTLQLLFTVPIDDTALVAGKFFASLGLLWTLVAATLVPPAVLYFISDVPIGQLCTGYLGLLLLAAFFASIGTWISLLVDTAVAAYVVTMGLCLVLFLGGALLADPAAGIWAPVSAMAEFMGLDPRMQNFRAGVLSIGDTVWFIAMTTIFLVLGHASLGARREHG